MLWFAARAGLIASDATLISSLAQLAAAGLAFALGLFFAAPLLTALMSSLSRFRDAAELLVLALIGGLFYGALVLALFGRRWLALLRKRAQAAPAASIDAFEGTSPPAGPDPV